jgi:hypothetical protein
MLSLTQRAAPHAASKRCFPVTRWSVKRRNRRWAARGSTPFYRRREGVSRVCRDRPGQLHLHATLDHLDAIAWWTSTVTCQIGSHIIY